METQQEFKLALDHYGKDKWEEMRPITVGASDIPVILGMIKDKSAEDVWNTKKGITKFEGNEFTEMGEAYEPIIIRSLHKILPTLRAAIGKPIPEMAPENVFSGKYTYQHPNYSWATATPDAFFLVNQEVENVQIKCSSSKQKWGVGLLPEDVYAQIQWEMFVTGIKKSHCVCRLFSYIASYEDKYFEVDWDAGFIEQILPKIKEFHNSLSLEANPWTKNKVTYDASLVKSWKDNRYYVTTDEDKAIFEKYASVIDKEKALKEANEDLFKKLSALEKEKKELAGVVLAKLEGYGDAVLPDTRIISRSIVNVKPSNGYSYARISLKAANN